MTASKTELVPLLSDTKWRRLRAAMLAPENPPPYKTTTLDGHKSDVDAEWFNHFQFSTYRDFRHLDIFVRSNAEREMLRKVLADLRLPGEETAEGFRVLGYANRGAFVDVVSGNRD